eukprot:COSAG06_NODE_34253_length_477_cov_1.007937_1_plen_75_part_01
MSTVTTVCLLTVSLAPVPVRLRRAAALYICVAPAFGGGTAGTTQSDASPARGGARLLPPLGQTKGTVANQETVVT